MVKHPPLPHVSLTWRWRGQSQRETGIGSTSPMHIHTTKQEGKTKLETKKKKEDIVLLHLKAYKHTVLNSAQFTDSLTTFL